MREQIKDATLHPLMEYPLDGKLSADSASIAKIIAQASSYTTIDGILYYVGLKKDSIPKVVVPVERRQAMIVG